MSVNKELVDRFCFKHWGCFPSNILVAIINLGSDFLLELLEFITRQGSWQELRTPLHQLPHQPLHLLHKRPFVGLDMKMLLKSHTQEKNVSPPRFYSVGYTTNSCFHMVPHSLNVVVTSFTKGISATVTTSSFLKGMQFYSSCRISL